jgi:hypothetical protein
MKSKINYHEKYLKYKNKYLALKKSHLMRGGAIEDFAGAPQSFREVCNQQLINLRAPIENCLQTANQIQDNDEKTQAKIACFNDYKLNSTTDIRNLNPENAMFNFEQCDRCTGNYTSYLVRTNNEPVDYRVSNTLDPRRRNIQNCSTFSYSDIDLVTGTGLFKYFAQQPNLLPTQPRPQNYKRIIYDIIRNNNYIIRERIAQFNDVNNFTDFEFRQIKQVPGTILEYKNSTSIRPPTEQGNIDYRLNLIENKITFCAEGNIIYANRNSIIGSTNVNSCTFVIIILNNGNKITIHHNTPEEAPQFEYYSNERTNPSFSIRQYLTNTITGDLRIANIIFVGDSQFLVTTNRNYDRTLKNLYEEYLRHDYINLLEQTDPIRRDLSENIIPANLSINHIYSKFDLIINNTNNILIMTLQ